MRQAGLGIFEMNLGFEELLLLASIVVPTVVSICLFTGVVTSDETAKKLAYVGFGVPFVAGILLFLWFEGAVGADYKYEVLFDRTGLQELGITFHLGLNGVSSPLFAMAGFVGWPQAWLPSIRGLSVSVCISPCLASCRPASWGSSPAWICSFISYSTNSLWFRRS